MKKILNLLMITMLIFVGIVAQAQSSCPASGDVTLSSVTSTPNTCGGNGSITATFTPFGSSSNVTVQLLKSGTVLTSVVNQGSPHTFSNLQPGTDYQVRVICSTNNNTIYVTQNASVANNYTPISNANISISNVCTNFTPGGTITVNGVTGGVGPYQYKVVQSNNPSFPETTGTYVTTNTFNVAAFGTYQIRVKDNCGNYMTFTRTLSPSVPPVRFYWKSKDICNSNQVEASTWWLTNDLTGGNANSSDYFPSAGIKLTIRSNNASGAILYDGTYTGGTFNYTPNTSHIYHATATNACGVTTTYIHTLDEPENNPEFLNFVPVASTSGCGASELETILINFGSQFFWKFPVTITVKNASNTTIHTSTSNGGIWSVSNLPVGTYTVTVTDSCSPTNSLTKTVTNPQSAGTPTLTLNSRPKWRCETGGVMALTQTGTIQAVIEINGYFPDRNNAIVKILSGPSNVGVNATYIDNRYWGWTNMLPGNYTVSYTSCNGTPYTGSFTINNNTDVLDQSISSTATSFCSGGGNITSNFIYDGASSFTVQLLNSSGTVIASNSTGNFSNVSPGTYSTRIYIQPCNTPSKYYYVNGNSVTITNSATGPSISSSVGVICEDASGNPLSTGSAYLDLNGVAPLKLQYRVSGSSTWTEINNAPTNTTISGLIANTLYELQLSDGCGGSTTSTVIIKTMGSLSSSNTVHPCNGSPYALTIPYYSGATYEWLNPQGAVVSSTRTYSVSSWNNSYNGTYLAKITWTNCVTRFVYVTVNSNQCGQPITEACYKNPVTAPNPIPSLHGITSLSRAGKDVSDQDNWPMVRQSAHTVLEAKTKGFVINRVATDTATGQVPTSVIASPQEGMMIYDTTKNCLKVFDGASWKCMTVATCPD